MADETLICGAHGETPVRYACRHVAGGVACGWHMADDDPEVGWCDGCEERLEAAGEWTSEHGKDLVVLCTYCFDEARTRNERLPDLVRGRAARLTPEEQRTLIQHAVHDTQARQKAADARWDLGMVVRPGVNARWDYDHDRRTLSFSNDGVAHAVADVRLVGSYSTKSSSFQWSWVLYETGDPFVRGIDDLPAFGVVRGIDKLSCERWDCEIVDAWEMTALAAYVVGCEAVYRAPFDHLYWFMLLDNFRVPA
jgi:hypothetical protein